MILRPYQAEAVAAVYEHLRTRDDNPCVVLPTGTGKSLVLAQIASDATTLWSGRVIILAHVKELLEQNADKIRLLCQGIDVGVYSAGLNSRDTSHSVIVAGIQSVYSRACDLGRFDLVIIDEAHLIPASGDGMYQQFLKAAKIINPDVRIIGMTATPFRLRGGTICKPENILNEVCYEAGIREMIVQGYLSMVRPFAGCIKPDLSKINIKAGEFVASEVEGVMDTNTMTQYACSEIVEVTKDREKVLIFASSVKHCGHVKDAIQKLSGEECAMITGETDANERATIISRFKGDCQIIDLFGTVTKPLKYLANVNVLTTGFDAPGVDCVVLLRPTASAGLYVQMVGRGTRIAPGKTDCLVLDYGDNVMRHGPLDDVKVKEPSEKKNHAAPSRECPDCNALVHASYRTCPECGFEFLIDDDPNVNGVSGRKALLSQPIEDMEYDITDVLYFVHTKRGAEIGAPKTLRVEYICGLSHVEKEWVCPEHTGWARARFERWWEDRSNAMIPDTAHDALQLSGTLAKPGRIVVRVKDKDSMPQIKCLDMEDKPDIDTPPWSQIAPNELDDIEDDLPF